MASRDATGVASITGTKIGCVRFEINAVNTPEI
jgi:hypothetical protein